MDNTHSEIEMKVDFISVILLKYTTMFFCKKKTRQLNVFVAHILESSSSSASSPESLEVPFEPNLGLQSLNFPHFFPLLFKSFMGFLPLSFREKRWRKSIEYS